MTELDEAAEGEEGAVVEEEGPDKEREKRRGLLEGKESGGFFAEFSTSGGNRVEEKRCMGPAEWKGKDKIMVERRKRGSSQWTNHGTRHQNNRDHLNNPDLGANNQLRCVIPRPKENHDG